MPRGSLSEDVIRLSDSIVACGVLPILARIKKYGWDDRPRSAALLTCYASFAADVSSFGAAERAILQEFDIACIAEAAWWAHLVMAFAQPEPDPAFTAELDELHIRLRLVADTLPNIFINARTAATEPGVSVIRIVLAADDPATCHPLRLSSAIEAMCLLWDVVSATAGSRAPLNLIACDPAPEITISFGGPAGTIKALKSLLMEVWDGIVVNHRATPDERLQIIPGNLPSLLHMGSANPSAMAQRQALVTGVRLFLEAGAFTPEMDDPDRFTPARLLGRGRVRARRNRPAPAPPDAYTAAGDDLAITGVLPEDAGVSRAALPTKPLWIGKVRVG